MREKCFRLRLFDDIISELSNAVLKTQPLLREVNDVLISYSGSRMRRLCSSYSAAATAGHGIPDYSIESPIPQMINGNAPPITPCSTYQNSIKFVSWL